MGFVLDDHYVIAQNAVIKNPSLYPKILTGGLFDAAHRTPESKLNYYRPVLTASLAVDYQLWGTKTFGYRIVNAALHAFNCVLVFALILLLFKSAPWAGFSSLIFCILPTHEWVVRYIVGRGDLLQASFSLLCLIGVLCHLKETKRRWWYLSLVSFTLAVLSREAAVLNVGFIFLITYYSTRQFKRTFSILSPFVILAAAYYVLRAATFPIAGEGLLSVVAAGGGGLVLAVSYVLHWLTPALVLAVLPQGVFLAGVLGFCSLALLVMIMRRDENFSDVPIAGFGILWIAVGLLPIVATARLIERLGPVLSEHFLYFSSIGFALLIALILERMRTLWARKLLFVGLVSYFLSIGLLNGSFWKDEQSLLTHVQMMEGREFTVAYEQLAMRFDDDETAVLGLINRASTFSNRSLWFKRLGNIYHRRGNSPAAIAALEQAVQLNPSNIEALNELGVVHLETGDQERGLAYLAQSVKIDPQGADAHRLIGTAFYAQGNFPSAIGAFQQALALDPDQLESTLHLMMAYYFVNDQAAYVRTMEGASVRFSDDRAVLRFVAQQLFIHGRFAETVKILKPTQQLFVHEPPMLALLAEAERRSARLPN